jgi:hypothetical protein
VSAIGEGLNDDHVYFGDDESDDLNTVYVHPSESKTSAIGTYVDDAVANFSEQFIFCGHDARPAEVASRTSRA